MQRATWRQKASVLPEGFSRIKKLKKKKRTIIVRNKKNNQSYLNIVGFGSFEFSYKLFLFLHLFQQLPFDFVSHNARFDLSLSNSKSKRFTQYGITEPSSRLHPTIVLEFTTVCSLNRL